MAYSEAVKLLTREWKAVTLAMLTGILITFCLAYILASTGQVNVAIILALAMTTIDMARTYVLIRITGKKVDWKKIAKRLCVDLGFLALLGLILVVLPATEAFAEYLERYDVAAIIGILWYFFLALYIVLIVDLFYMGYLVAVEDMSVEEALIESAKRFRKGKIETVKKAVMYWAPMLIYFIGNWLAGQTSGAIATAITWGTIIITALVVLPLMEATYTVSNRVQ